MTHEVINGAFKKERTKEDRHIVSPEIVMTVKPDGHTACFVRNGKKLPMGSDSPAVTNRHVKLFVGEIDGVRGYATLKDGRVHITMSRANMAV